MKHEKLYKCTYVWTATVKLSLIYSLFVPQQEMKWNVEEELRSYPADHLQLMHSASHSDIFVDLHLRQCTGLIAMLYLWHKTGKWLAHLHVH